MNKIMNMVGIILVFIIGITAASPALAASFSTGGPVRVAVYTDSGVNPDKILATFRAVQAAGFAFYGIGRSDIRAGRLTRSNYDVLLFPAGEADTKAAYSDAVTGLDSSAYKTPIKAFVNGGGGFVALEGGAYWVSQNGGTLDLYCGNYTRGATAGKTTLTITDPGFGTGTQEVYQTAGGGYFSLPAGSTQVAANSANKPVIARCAYGTGRVIVSAVDPELRGDSELDWTVWDNWAMNGTQANSIGAWKLLGRMINWAATGTATLPAITETPNPTGARVAIVSTHTTDGGAWPGLIPAVARAVEYSGYIPLSIRFDEIKGGKLTLSNFKVVIFPGGYSYGYKTGLSGYEVAIKNFASAGGGVMGICAGSYYLAKTVVWNGKTYPYAGLFAGTDTGPLTGLLYPSYTLTTTTINDPLIGSFGAQTQMYYGGGYKTNLAGSNASTVATYTYGSYNGQANAIRFTLGSGHVFLIGTHPESRSGSNEDWLTWDNYVENTNTPLTNPDNPWLFFKAVLDNWLTK